MSMIDGPLNVIGHAIGGVFGWTFAFIVALHVGMFIGLSSLGHGTAHPFILVMGLLLLTISGLAGNIGYLFLLVLMFFMWWLPLYSESLLKRVLVLAAACALAALVSSGKLKFE